MKAALLLVMPPSPPTVAMPNGAEFKQPLELCLGAVAVLVGLHVALIEHQHGDNPARTMAPANEMRRKHATILAQEIEIEPGGAAGARRGTDQRNTVRRHDIRQRQRLARFRPQREPMRERGVDVNDATVGRNREQALRQIIVKRQGGLEAAHDLNLTHALAGDIAYLPKRRPALAPAER